jgi:hypothetical protein
MHFLMQRIIADTCDAEPYQNDATQKFIHFEVAPSGVGPATLVDT